MSAVSVIETVCECAHVLMFRVLCLCGFVFRVVVAWFRLGTILKKERPPIFFYCFFFRFVLLLV